MVGHGCRAIHGISLEINVIIRLVSGMNRLVNNGINRFMNAVN